MSRNNFKVVVRRAAAGLGLLGAALPAMAQVNGQISQTLGKALCFVAGSNSPLVAFVAGVAVVTFFVVLALNEGKSMVSWAIKIMIGVAGLICVTSILSTLFNLNAMFAC